MSSFHSRRELLRRGGGAAALFVSTGFSGCGSLDGPPSSGSVVFDNHLDVPQIVTLRVVSGPVDVNDPTHVAGMNVALRAGERRTVTSVFTNSGTYVVEGWLLSQNPSTTRWEAETAEVELRPEDEYSEYLLASIREEGGLLELTPMAVG